MRSPPAPTAGHVRGGVQASGRPVIERSEQFDDVDNLEGVPWLPPTRELERMQPGFEVTTMSG